MIRDKEEHRYLLEKHVLIKGYVEAGVIIVIKYYQVLV